MSTAKPTAEQEAAARAIIDCVVYSSLYHAGISAVAALIAERDAARAAVGVCQAIDRRKAVVDERMDFLVATRESPATREIASRQLKLNDAEATAVREYDAALARWRAAKAKEPT